VEEGIKIVNPPITRSPHIKQAKDKTLTQTALRERVKELTCLYAIAQVSGKPGVTLDEVLQGVVDVLPTAWQFPNIASTQITLDGVRFGSRKQLAPGARQEAPIVVRGLHRGMVHVGYPPSFKPGPGRSFLDEEQRLLDEVARQVGLIVDRKETAAEQERLHAKLRHADRLVTIGQLAAGVAHELNEPLGSILGFAQLLAKTPRLPRQVRKDIAKIQDSTLHAREIIRQLMTFARQKPPRDVRANISRLIVESVGIWLPRCEAEGVRLEYALDKSIPEIVADDGQLRQVVTNLVVNAVQAMPNGGVLRIETARDGEWLCLSVCDTGVGIPPEVLPRIFDPFFTTKDVDQGTGLGLSVVHGIVSGHEGKISVESAPGRGTRVSVRLPLHRSPDQPPNRGGHLA
jgi:two-component system, NtrC family, sensor kinase